MTADEYEYYISTCESYKFAGQEGHDTEDDIFQETGLTEQDVCEFAVYGLPTHKWLNMEADLNSMVAATEKLRAQLNEAYKQLVDRYRIANKTSEEIKDQLNSNIDKFN